MEGLIDALDVPAAGPAHDPGLRQSSMSTRPAALDKLTATGAHRPNRAGQPPGPAKRRQALPLPPRPLPDEAAPGGASGGDQFPLGQCHRASSMSRSRWSSTTSMWLRRTCERCRVYSIKHVGRRGRRPQAPAVAGGRPSGRFRRPERRGSRPPDPPRPPRRS